MRNQALLLAAGAAVVIGCGGGSHHSSTKSSTNSTTGSGLTVSLDPSFGRVEVAYLTGVNRASGDVHLEVDSQSIENVGGLNLLSSEILARDLNLTSYSEISARLNVPFTTTTSGRPNSINYTQLPFQPARAYYENTVGGQTDVTLPSNIQPALLDARIRAFPGRSTTVALRVSGESFQVDQTANTATFNLSTFQGLNYSTVGTDPDAMNRVPSRLSDFVRFPLAGLALADRPNLRNGYGTGDVLTNGATFVYFSGDNVALSNDSAGGGSIFQEVTDDPNVISIGEWQNGSTDVGFVGTYDLRDNAPQVLEPTAPTVISQFGEFRDYNQVLLGGSNFEVVMFPNSSETYTFEGSSASGVTGRLGDMIAFVRTNGTITNIYYGGVDLGAGTFTLFPIRALGLDPGDTSVTNLGISGTVSGYTNASGSSTGDFPSIRHFNYSFTNAPPTGFNATGTATVFRI